MIDKFYNEALMEMLQKRGWPPNTIEYIIRQAIFELFPQFNGGTKICVTRDYMVNLEYFSEFPFTEPRRVNKKGVRAALLRLVGKALRTTRWDKHGYTWFSPPMPPPRRRTIVLKRIGVQVTNGFRMDTLGYDTQLLSFYVGYDGETDTLYVKFMES